MPKLLFYAGTAFCLFLALTSAAESMREVQGGMVAFADYFRRIGEMGKKTGRSRG